MLLERVRDIIREARNAATRFSSNASNRPNGRRARGDERIVMWYDDQRVELAVEAWLRGH
jgi:hypothetical protein